MSAKKKEEEVVQEEVEEEAEEKEAKEEARSLLLKGVPPKEVAEKTGLSLPQVYGLMGPLGRKKTKGERRGKTFAEAAEEELEEEEAKVLDPKQQFIEFLRIYGFSKRDATGIAEYMSPYGYDNLPKLEEALRNYSVSLNRRRVVIESWANLRGVRIPGFLIERLKLDVAPYEEESAYSYSYGGYRKPQPANEMAAVINALSNFMRSMNSQPPNSMNAVNPIVASLQREVADIRRQIQEEQERRLFEALQSLRNEVEELKSGYSRISNQFTVWESGIRELSGIIREYLSLARAAMTPSARKIEVKRKIGGESSIFDYLPSEYVEEGGE